MATFTPNWTMEEVSEWVKENFSEETAKSFRDQDVDGETLQMLVNCATIEQLHACGLKTIKEQMKLRRLFGALTNEPQCDTSPTISVKGSSYSSGGSCATPTGTRKLTLSEIKQLSPEEKRLYLMKRNKVAAAARDQWPGNDIPTFRNDKLNQKKLDKLVQTLVPECSLAFFGEKAIRLHILDTLTERRRNIKKGYDYENPPIRKKLKMDPEEEIAKEEIAMAAKGKDTEGSESDGRDGNDSSSSVIAVEKNSSVATSKGIEPDDNNASGDDLFDDTDSEDDYGDMSLKSAEVVVMCAFGAHFIKEVSRSQLCAAAKTLLPREERRALQGAEKSKFLKPLAKMFVDRDIVAIKGNANLENLAREDVDKVGTY